MVHGSGGAKPAGELNAALRKSKIKGLAKKAMTAREMGLDHRHMQVLKNTGIVRRLRYADPGHRVAVWTTGPKFQALLKNWDRWC